MRAKLINEGMFDDAASQNALSSWYRTLVTTDNDNYLIETEKPISVIIHADDKAKLQFLFNKYKIPYKIKNI